MAKLKGEITFLVDMGEGEQAFTLLLDWNALCELEEDLPGIMQGQIALNSPRVVRRVMHCALRAKHDWLDEKAAGTMISQLGMTRVNELLTEAFIAAFPEAGEATENPPKKSSARTKQ